MSHRTELVRGWVAIHNGDYSGDVTFCNRESDDEEAAYHIPFDILVELVAEAVRTSAISTLQDAGVVELIPGLDPSFLSGGPEADAVRAQTKDKDSTCGYCGGAEVFDGICRACLYDVRNVNRRRCVESYLIQCRNDALGTSQHCADHQYRHSAVEDESVSEPRCAVCLEPRSYPIHTKERAPISLEGVKAKEAEDAR